MASRERSKSTDRAHSARTQAPRTPHHRTIDRGFAPDVNKRSVLGLLTLLVGTGASATVDGLVVGVPLLAVGCYLLARPLLGASRAR